MPVRIAMAAELDPYADAASAAASAKEAQASGGAVKKEVEMYTPKVR